MRVMATLPITRKDAETGTYEYHFTPRPGTLPSDNWGQHSWERVDLGASAVHIVLSFFINNTRYAAYLRSGGVDKRT
jgi:hypothetical protein